MFLNEQKKRVVQVRKMAGSYINGRACEHTSGFLLIQVVVT